MRFLPALALVAFTTFFVEFVVGRSIVSFLDPGTFIFLFVGYGLVILVLRELAVKHKLGISGILLWGVAYGIINEGLLAKTMIRSVDLPVNLYDQYGVIFGISWPWSAAIALWHAFAAVLFPILFVHALFPKHKDEQWLSTATTHIIGGILAVLLCIVFLADEPVKGMPRQLIAFLIIIASLAILGYLSKGSIAQEPVKRRWGLLLFGFSVIIPFWALALIARAKFPVVVFLSVFAAVILFYGWVMRKNRWDALPGLLFFGIGFYLHNVVQAFIILLFTNPAVAFVHTIISVSLLAALFQRMGERDEPARS